MPDIPGHEDGPSHTEALARIHAGLKTEPLFGTRGETVVCFHCGAAAEIDQPKCKPGEIHYKPCSACGQIGIRREGDLYQQIKRKKRT